MNYKPIKEVRDQLKDFDCGNDDLNVYLKCFAYQNDKNGIGKTFVLFDNNQLVGFMTLCSASINFEEAPKGLNLPKYPIPAIKIARLAVDKRFQGKGYGKELLRHSLDKIATLSTFIGVRFVVVDAKEESKAFYERYGFTPLPNKKRTYILPIDLVKKVIK